MRHTFKGDSVVCHKKNSYIYDIKIVSSDETILEKKFNPKTGHQGRQFVKDSAHKLAPIQETYVLSSRFILTSFTFEKTESRFEDSEKRNTWN